MAKPKVPEKGLFAYAGIMALLGAALVISGIGVALARGAQSSVAAHEVAFSRGEFASSTASSEGKAGGVLHLPTPVPLKAIYMTQCAVGTLSLRNSLVKFIEDSDLNAVIIDIRDYTGRIGFKTDDPELKDAVSDTCRAPDMKDFVKELHEKKIYVIGRITTFQNPYYVKMHPDQAVQNKGGGVWKDHKGLGFVDVGAKPYWEQTVHFAKISYELGFDELNFDYVRFPSDGNMAQAVYTWDAGKTKQEALESFFKYLHDELKPTGMVMSADLFGMAATNEDDLNIGQVLERTMPYFDFVCPMVYPSHYPTGFNGYKNVNEHSYDIVYAAMKRAVERAEATSTPIATFGSTKIASTSPQLYTKPQFQASKIRPWLQSFDYPVTYTPAMVKEQIRATNDAGLTSWFFWDAANKYRSLREVLIAPKAE